jgi:prophage regulatory protein
MNGGLSTTTFDEPAPGAAKNGKRELEMNEQSGGARRMLTIDQVLQIVPIGRSTLKRKIRLNDFPPPHYLSANKPIWYEDEVRDWQAALPNKSPRKRSKAGQSRSGEAR